MSEFKYTKDEAIRLVNNSGACPRCRQAAATCLLTNHRHAAIDEVTRFRATLLHNAGREAHTCGQ